MCALMSTQFSKVEINNLIPKDPKHIEAKLSILFSNPELTYLVVQCQ